MDIWGKVGTELVGLTFSLLTLILLLIEITQRRIDRMVHEKDPHPASILEHRRKSSQLDRLRILALSSAMGLLLLGYAMRVWVWARKGP
jgi:hypothetical protein